MTYTNTVHGLLPEPVMAEPKLDNYVKDFAIVKNNFTNHFENYQAYLKTAIKKSACFDDLIPLGKAGLKKGVHFVEGLKTGLAIPLVDMYLSTGDSITLQVGDVVRISRRWNKQTKKYEHETLIIRETCPDNLYTEVQVKELLEHQKMNVYEHLARETGGISKYEMDLILNTPLYPTK
ncbi:MAG: hypothetical protein V4615_05165 [Bacteroidota bacterium]